MAWTPAKERQLKRLLRDCIGPDYVGNIQHAARLMLQDAERIAKAPASDGYTLSDAKRALKAARSFGLLAGAVTEVT